MTNLYTTSRESKTVEIEEFSRDGFPFRMIITLRKLGVVTMLDYLLTPEEAENMAKTLNPQNTTPPMTL